MLGRNHLVSLKLLFSLLAVGSISTIFGGVVELPACGADTLAGYVTNTATPAGGCVTGVLDYFNFSYHPITNAPLASSINVAPFETGFSFGPVSAAPGQTVSFEIDYQIFIDPDVYPMNWAWWDGKMSFEHYREEHGLDAATLLEAAREEASATSPEPGIETVTTAREELVSEETEQAPVDTYH